MLRYMAIGFLLVALTACGLARGDLSRPLVYTETKDEYVFKACSFCSMQENVNFAKAHCAKYNRVHRFVSRNRLYGMMHFQCVDP
jgi:hypothetical protein